MRFVRARSKRRTSGRKISEPLGNLTRLSAPLAAPPTRAAWAEGLWTTCFTLAFARADAAG